ncbi:MAG TPA: SPOR domain-containing protein, partial [Nitrospiria bacterium]|nr:SPOR domain-containing protein [Nitrospiria bacterium]
FLLVSFENHSEGTGAVEVKEAAPPAATPEKTVTKKPEPQTRFTFYETLTHLEPGSFLPEDFKVDPVNAPVNKTRKPAPAPQPEESYTIQVAALGNPEAAEALSAQLRQKGYPVQIHSLSVPNRGTLFRVRVGRFESRKEAEGLAGKIKREEGLSPFITPAGK